MGTVTDLSARRRRQPAERDTVTITITLSTQAWAALAQMAVDRGAHVSEVVEGLVREAERE